MNRMTRALVAAASTVAMTAGPAAAQAAPPRHLLDISVRSTPAAGVAANAAPSPGDRLFLVDTLYTWNHGKRGARVGHVESTLTFMSAFGRHGAAVEISGQMFLPGGSLFITGIARVGQGPSHFTLPVLGGTGAYAGARGTIDLRDLGRSEDKSDITLHLSTDQASPRTKHPREGASTDRAIA